MYIRKRHSRKDFSFSSYILVILIYFCLIQIMLFILLSTLHDFIQTPPLCAFASVWISQRVVWVLCTHSLTQWQRQSFFRFTMFLANFIHTRIKGIKEPLEQERWRKGVLKGRKGRRGDRPQKLCSGFRYRQPFLDSHPLSLLHSHTVSL